MLLILTILFSPHVKFQNYSIHGTSCSVVVPLSFGTCVAKFRDERRRGLQGRLSGPVTAHKNRNSKETMMRNEMKIVEDGVIFELEIEEVEEVVAPGIILAG